MKYLVLLGDGMADHEIKEFGGKTPLEIADKPYMDALAKKSVLGMAVTVPDALAPGSDVANLAVMGYNPLNYYTGRSPLEAVSIGVELYRDDVTFRCNLVTLSEEERYEEKTMVDYSADEITTDEAHRLIEDVNRELGTQAMEFFAGISYRHLLVWHGAEGRFNLTPPHDISDRKITQYLPNDEKLLDMMKKSYEILENHPVNIERKKRGLHPANSIWLWGNGTKPTVTSFTEKTGLRGSVISAVDLVKGIGMCAGMNIVDVEGATGNINTNFEGKARAAVAEFKNGADFVYLHFEAPDECGHRGETENKIKSIEYLDSRVLKIILEEMENEDIVILIMPDHPTPLDIKTHTREAVPFMIYKSTDIKDNPDFVYTEKCAREKGIFVQNGYTLIDMMIN